MAPLPAQHADRQSQARQRLRVVPDAGSPEFTQFLADLDPEFGPPAPSLLSESRQVTAERETLLAADLPVTTPMAPEQLRQLDKADENADVHASALVGIGLARFRRCLHQLPAVERHVVSLRWGLGCHVHTRAAVAHKTGLSVRAVEQTEERVAAMLRAYFAVPGQRVA